MERLLVLVLDWLIPVVCTVVLSSAITSGGASCRRKAARQQLSFFPLVIWTTLSIVTLFCFLPKPLPFGTLFFARILIDILEKAPRIPLFVVAQRSGNKAQVPSDQLIANTLAKVLGMMSQSIMLCTQSETTVGSSSG